MLRGCSALTAQLLGGPLHAAPAAALANAATRAARRAYAADMVPTASKEEQAQEQQQKQQAPGDSEWTEVVDQGTGQTYFWNESTGETTQLGEPRPKTRFRDQGWSGAGDPRFQEGWREPPGKDLTYFYSLMGIAIGIGAGWATRFFH